MDESADDGQRHVRGQGQRRLVLWRDGHAPKAATNSADDEIVRLVRDDARPQEIRVVTSDNTLINPVNAAGASVYPAESFRNLIDPP